MASATTADVDPDGFTLYTNPFGIWNNFTGMYEEPVGRYWNRRYWAKRKQERKRTASPAKKDPQKRTKKPKVRREESSEDETASKQKTKSTAPVLQVTTDRQSGGGSGGRDARAHGHEAVANEAERSLQQLWEQRLRHPAVPERFEVLRMPEVWTLRKRIPGHRSEDAK
ncbi:hypothetical protein P3T76_007388 [Phytophthora citrophthora]|uniref:Uncharacterized protein n=1 Tax=Phytophthora citrophthora TaxID=4793 RepID=A0AAD9GMX4_9STRA|nr:hypothetical protein P3T76_007388 [Phytophthora citrophthora]